MKKLMRLLALTLAAAMLLSVGALAAESEGAEDGPKLVWAGLNWDEGHFVDDDVLSGRVYGMEEMQLAPGDECAAIFFLIGENGTRTPVIPEAGKGVAIRKLEKDEIASGAKRSDYYVCVSIADWTDSEITSGKAAMKVTAALPDVGFYTKAEAAQSTLLRNDQQPMDPSQLTDNTFYFIRNETDPDQRKVTDVKKNSSGNSNMYDLEKVSDNVWKITLKIPKEGSAGVNLDVAFQETDGSTYTEQRGYGFEYPRGPELWLRWLDEDQYGYCLSEDAEAYGGFQPHPGDECALIFYTCDYDDKDEQTLTPVLVKDLKGSDGVTITDVSDQSADPMARYFVKVTVADWEKEYTITSGDYTMHFNSDLPNIGLYSKPELSVDAYLRDWRFSPVDPAETVYIGSYVPEGDDRVLTDLKLTQFENSDQFTLEKYNDQFYKLTRKTLDLSGTDIQFECTWKWSDGHAEIWNDGVWTEPYMSTLISEEPFIDSIENRAFYDDVKDIASNSITLKAGETKTVYIAHTYYRDDWGGWRVMTAAPAVYSASSGLKVEYAVGYPTKYTISSTTPGSYQIGIGGVDILLYDKDGKDVTEEVFRDDIYNDYDFETGTWYLLKIDGEGNAEPYAFDGRIEAKSMPFNPGWYPITVTVTGGGSTAATPETPTAFSDVPAASWYAPAVAFANENGYMKGTPDGSFNPKGQIKGSEFAQILYNKEGKPAAADGASFQGVDSQWYAAPILWAAGKGIISDTGDAALVPTADLTRQQIALMLYNYMGKPEGRADLSAFTDAGQISAWALDAVQWAVGEGILKGSNNVLNPVGTATRAETAQILLNFFG